MIGKRLLSLILTVVLCMTLVACGNSTKTTDTNKDSGSKDTPAITQPANQPSEESSSDAVSLRVAWWGGQERHNMTIEALDAYTEKNGTQFTYEYNSWGSYFENLATQAVGNNLPDIIQMSTTDIINFSKNGQIIYLQPYVDKGIIDTTNMEENSLSGGMVDGKLMGITTGVNTVTVVYNKEIFDQAKVAYPTEDWTWSQFLEKAKAVYDATGIQTEIPFLSEARWLVENMVRCFGYDFFSKDGLSLPWAKDEKVVTAVEKAIQDIYDGVKAGYFVDPEVQVAWSTTEDSYIAQGKASMSFLLSNFYAVYSTALGKELGMVLLPRLDEGSQTGMYLNPNMYWCISSNCKNPEVAAKVINYLINDEEACSIIGTDRGIFLSSAIRNMLSSSADTDVYTNNTIKYLSKVSGYVDAINPADPLNSAEAISVLKTNFQAAMYGEMSAKDCIADFIAQSSTILQQ